MTRLSTFADFVRLHYGLTCECPKCGRFVRLNLAAVIFAGKGDHHVYLTININYAGPHAAAVQPAVSYLPSVN